MTVHFLNCLKILDHLAETTDFVAAVLMVETYPPIAGMPDLMN
jgi:hypothetical protein